MLFVTQVHWRSPLPSYSSQCLCLCWEPAVWKLIPEEGTSIANIYESTITLFEWSHANFPIQCRDCGHGCHGCDLETLCECKQYFFHVKKGSWLLCLASCREVLFFAFGPVVLQTVWKLKAGSVQQVLGEWIWWEEPLEFFDKYWSFVLFFLTPSLKPMGVGPDVLDLSIVWLGKSCTIIVPACCRHACHVTRLGHPANCGFAGSILIMNPSVGDAQMVYCGQGFIDGNHKQCHQNSRIYSLQYSIEIDSLTETVHTCSTTRHDETRHIIWILCSIEGLQSHSVQMDPSSCGKCPSNIPNNSFYPRSLWF